MNKLRVKESCDSQMVFRDKEDGKLKELKPKNSIRS